MTKYILSYSEARERGELVMHQENYTLALAAYLNFFLSRHNKKRVWVTLNKIGK